MNETNENETNETDRMANTNAEIDPSMIERVVGDIWNTYLGAVVEPRAERTAPAEARVTHETVEARVRISGDVAWEVTLRGSWSSAEEATRRMLGSRDHVEGSGGGDASTPEYILDGWGELVNALAGNLKASLDFGAHALSIPTVFRDQPSSAATRDMSDRDTSEFLFEWDGYLAMVRITRITPV